MAFLKWPDAYQPEIVRLARPHHWAEARQWLVYMLVGGCLPFWGTSFLLLVFAVRPSASELLGRGELAVFSAGLLASAIPILRKKVKRSPVEQPEGLLTTCIVLLLPAALTFAAVTLADNFKSLPTPHPVAILVVSVLLFLTSLVIGFFTELINNVRHDPDIVVLDAGEQEKLRSRFVSALEGQ
jgi:hypothetical protein